jgi:ferric-dicitrate binding protein FerR (iron transport regulator)
MTTAPAALPELPDDLETPAPSVGERHRRRQARRRLAREHLAVVVFLIVALAVTVVILGQQWLESGSTGTSGTVGAISMIVLGGSP